MLLFSSLGLICISIATFFFLIKDNYSKYDLSQVDEENIVRISNQHESSFKTTSEKETEFSSNDYTGVNQARLLKYKQKLSKSSLPASYNTLLDLSLQNKINQKVSFYITEKSLQTLEKKVQSNKQLQNDLHYISEIFSQISDKISKGEVGEQEIRRIVHVGHLIARDRTVSPGEINWFLHELGRNFDITIDKKEFEIVLEDLRKDGQRGELKKHVSQEIGTIAASIMENPVGRRLTIYGIQRLMSLYEEKLFKRLPPSVDKVKMKILINMAMNDIIENKMKGAKVSRLSEMVFDSIMDRKISHQEMNRIAAFLTTNNK